MSYCFNVKFYIILYQIMLKAYKMNSNQNNSNVLRLNQLLKDLL